MKDERISENILGRHDGSCWVWHLKRNISIAPQTLAYIFLALGFVSGLIGAVFYLAGATLILPFSVLEMTALLIAYFYNAIHANDYEKLIVEGNVIQIESKFGLQLNQMRFVKSMTRIETLSHLNELIRLQQGTKDTYFGRYVHANLRPLLAQKIADRLRSN